MKKLLLILLCFPMIGFGQITVTEVTTGLKKKDNTSVQKKQNHINPSYSFRSGLAIEIFPSNGMIPQRSFLSCNLIPNVNYNIAINNIYSIYNNVALPIILRFPKTVMFEASLLTTATGDLQITELRYIYPTTLITKLEYNVGIQAEMYEGLQSRLGIIIPIIGYPIKLGSGRITSNSPSSELQVTDGGQGSDKQWGGGFNIGFDYSFIDNISGSLSISQEWISSPFANSLNHSGSPGTVTEILIGVNYKL